MRQSLATAIVAGAVALTTAFAQPVFAARGGGTSGGGGMTHMSTGRSGMGHMRMAHMSMGHSMSMGHTPSGFSRGTRTGSGRADAPPGWSHGEKTGWHGGSMPPGLSR